MSEFKSPAIQAMNLIRYIGDQVSESGEPVDTISGGEIQHVIEAPSAVFAEQLIEDLYNAGLIRIGSDTIRTLDGGATFLNVNLSLAGWNQYEAEKRGKFDGNYGFIAMQFGDSSLDPFVQDVVKPSVKDGIGYDLVDVRDRSRAGVIDNIIRTEIRDAAFVLVDLTHDNSGAYWEAGYAEGLGKPVIYICEKEKFDAKKTHFDTNHCTTVPWSRDDDEGFRRELIATLRRSLDSSS